MEEKDKKRKANESPHGKGIKKYYREDTPQQQIHSEDDPGVKGRTPSGTVLSNSVGEIRTIFSLCKELGYGNLDTFYENSQEINQPCTTEPLKELRERDTNINSSVNVNAIKRKARSAALKHQSVNSKTKQQGGVKQKLLGSRITHQEELSASNMKEVQSSDTSDTSVKTGEDLNSRSKPSEVKTTLESAVDGMIGQIQAQKQEMGDDRNSVSITQVLEMFQQIKEEIKTKWEPAEQMQHIQTKCSEEVSAAMNQLHEQEKMKIDKMTADLSEWKHRTEVLTDVCERMNTKMADLTQKLENLELNNAKRSVAVSGLELNGQSKDDDIEDIRSFFSEFLKLEVEIEDFYTVGKNGRTAIVSFQSLQQKRQIMEAKSLLKNVRNSRKEKIYINNNLPIFTQEKNRREREIMKLAKETPGIKPENVKFIKGKLSIQGDIYRKKVLPPTPNELVNMDVQDLKKILDFPLQTGQQIRKEGSFFTAYSAAVSTHQQICDLYRRLKLTEPNARHIVCAYVIDNTKKVYFNRDFVDDGEPGAGRILLNVMVNNNIEERVIFVARRYGGMKLGADRFSCYTEVAKSVINLNPFNSILKINQYITETEKDQRKNTYRLQKEKGNPTVTQLQIPTNETATKYVRTAQQKNPHSSIQGRALMGTRGSYYGRIVKENRSENAKLPLNTGLQSPIPMETQQALERQLKQTTLQFRQSSMSKYLLQPTSRETEQQQEMEMEQQSEMDSDDIRGSVNDWSSEDAEDREAGVD